MITPQLAAMGKNCLPQEGTKLASSHMVLEATKGQLFSNIAASSPLLSATYWVSAASGLQFFPEVELKGIG